MALQLVADKNVLITGAGSGLGRDTTVLFAASGANVLAADRDLSAVEDTVGQCSGSGHVVAHRCDVSDSGDVEAMVRAAVARFGQLDCAVNNAGLAPDDRPVDALDEASFEAITEVNLLGVAWCMKHEMAAMKQQERGGSIVNIGSTRSFRASATAPAYSATKSGVLGLTESAALAGGADGIRVNAVCPGVMATPMVAKRLADSGDTEEAYVDRVGGVLRRIATPAEVAQAVLWLCSDLSSYVTGHSLVADGGYLAR